MHDTLSAVAKIADVNIARKLRAEAAIMYYQHLHISYFYDDNGKVRWVALKESMHVGSLFDVNLVAKCPSLSPRCQIIFLVPGFPGGKFSGGWIDLDLSAMEVQNFFFNEQAY